MWKGKKNKKEGRRTKRRALNHFNKQISQPLYHRHSCFSTSDRYKPLFAPNSAWKTKKEPKPNMEPPTKKVSRWELKLAFSTPRHAIPTNVQATTHPTDTKRKSKKPGKSTKTKYMRGCFWIYKPTRGFRLSSCVNRHRTLSPLSQNREVPCQKGRSRIIRWRWWRWRRCRPTSIEEYLLLTKTVSSC
jgi:hypothetical protein